MGQVKEGKVHLVKGEPADEKGVDFLGVELAENWHLRSLSIGIVLVEVTGRRREYG